MREILAFENAKMEFLHAMLKEFDGVHWSGGLFLDQFFRDQFPRQSVLRDCEEGLEVWPTC